ncbi:hypothetical protein EVAR_64999_1, partial [Eumeta japonica]
AILDGLLEVDSETHQDVFQNVNASFHYASNVRRLDNLKRSWSTMQEIVTRSKIECMLLCVLHSAGRGVGHRLGSWLLPGPHRRFGTCACRFKSHGADACVSGAVGCYRRDIEVICGE